MKMKLRRSSSVDSLTSLLLGSGEDGRACCHSLEMLKHMTIEGQCENHSRTYCGRTMINQATQTPENWPITLIERSSLLEAGSGQAIHWPDLYTDWIDRWHTKEEEYIVVDNVNDVQDYGSQYRRRRRRHQAGDCGDDDQTQITVQSPVNDQCDDNATNDNCTKDATTAWLQLRLARLANHRIEEIGTDSCGHCANLSRLEMYRKELSPVCWAGNRCNQLSSTAAAALEKQPQQPIRDSQSSPAPLSDQTDGKLLSFDYNCRTNDWSNCADQFWPVMESGGEQMTKAVVTSKQQWPPIDGHNQFDGTHLNRMVDLHRYTGTPLTSSSSSSNQCRVATQSIQTESIDGFLRNRSTPITIPRPRPGSSRSSSMWSPWSCSMRSFNSVDEFNQEIADLMEQNRTEYDNESGKNGGRCPPVIELLGSASTLASGQFGHQTPLVARNKRANDESFAMQAEYVCSPFTNCDVDYSCWPTERLNKRAYAEDDQWLFDVDLEDQAEDECSESLLVPISSKSVKLNDDKVMSVLSSPQMIANVSAAIANADDDISKCEQSQQQQLTVKRNEAQKRIMEQCKPIIFQASQHDESDLTIANNLLIEFLHQNKICRRSQQQQPLSRSRSPRSPKRDSFILKPSYQSAFLPVNTKHL